MISMMGTITRNNLFFIFSLFFKVGAEDFTKEVAEHPKFTQEQKITDFFERLCKKCKNSQKKGTPKQEIIDAARQLVMADDEFKAQKNVLTAFCYRYPVAEKIGLVTAGAIGIKMLEKLIT
jgi:hypothetical protein